MQRTINALLTLGVSGPVLRTLLDDLVDNMELNSEARGLAVYAWYWELHDRPEPANWTYDDGGITVNGFRYAAVHKAEVAAAYKEQIKDDMKLVSVDFLSKMIGVDESIIRGLRDKDENAVICTLIKGSCGWDALVKTLTESEGEDGRRHMLEIEGEEVAYRDWFIYQLHYGTKV